MFSLSYKGLQLNQTCFINFLYFMKAKSGRFDNYSYRIEFQPHVALQQTVPRWQKLICVFRAFLFVCSSMHLSCGTKFCLLSFWACFLEGVLGVWRLLSAGRFVLIFCLCFFLHVLCVLGFSLCTSLACVKYTVWFLMHKDSIFVPPRSS